MCVCYKLDARGGCEACVCRCFRVQDSLDSPMMDAVARSVCQKRKMDAISLRVYYSHVWSPYCWCPVSGRCPPGSHRWWSTVSDIGDRTSVSTCRPWWSASENRIEIQFRFHFQLVTRYYRRTRESSKSFLYGLHTDVRKPLPGAWSMPNSRRTKVIT